MGQINLYRIDMEKSRGFIQELSQKMNKTNSLNIEIESSGQIVLFGFTLYLSRDQEESDLEWNWLLSIFEQPLQRYTPNPKAVVLIEKGDIFYAVTFGRAYFLVDKFCDSDFGFKFARRTEFQQIKTTALTSPISRRNKVVNTYINYNELEFDSGESFTKIKAKANLGEGFTTFKENIEIGGSIRFTIENNDLNAIASLVLHVEHVISNPNELYKIPVFSKVNDKDLLNTLDANLAENIKNERLQISFSEMDIVGTTEIFRSSDIQYDILHKGVSKPITHLEQREIENFCAENGFNYKQEVLNIRIRSYINGEMIDVKTIHSLIDHIDDTERCILSKGKWYRFNDDYLSYLKDSLYEIDAIYDPLYDFSRAQHKLYLDLKYAEEKDEEKYIGKSQAEIKKSISDKYYAERWYNIHQSEYYGFQNYDRTEQRFGLADVEMMDLYKADTMYAVKIGSSSSKLCYAVDQSLSSLKLYKHNRLPSMPPINTVAIWIILENRSRLPTVNDKPDINILNMLMLKNRLDQWKKEVRLAGFKPLININYVVD